MDMTTVYFILAGAIGTGLKAWISTDQATFSKKSISEVIIGGAIGGLSPMIVQSYLPPSVAEVYAHASVLQQALWLGVTAYATTDFITSALARLGVGQAPTSVLSPAPISGDPVAARKIR